MQFDEMGLNDGKILFLFPGTACDYQTNFGSVLSRLGEKYHLVCVNYDGFDGSGLIFPDMITITENIERYINKTTADTSTVQLDLRLVQALSDS